MSISNQLHCLNWGYFYWGGAAKSRPFPDQIISLQPDNINYLNTYIMKCLNPRFKMFVMIFQVTVIISAKLCDW